MRSIHRELMITARQTRFALFHIQPGRRQQVGRPAPAIHTYMHTYMHTYIFTSASKAPARVGHRSTGRSAKDAGCSSSWCFCFASPGLPGHLQWRLDRTPWWETRGQARRRTPSCWPGCCCAGPASLSCYLLPSHHDCASSPGRPPADAGSPLESSHCATPRRHLSWLTSSTTAPL
jgi:hypothetical protein